MRKNIIQGILGGLLVLVLVITTVTAAFAAKPDKETPKTPADFNGLNHPGNTSQLYLYEKDPTEWEIAMDGAWGKMSFDSGNFVFNGHGLVAGTAYTLIRYVDPWPGSPVCLAEGTADEFGDIHLSGEMKPGGPKVWLVLSGDVDCGNGLTAWNPTEYLFEYNVIGGYVETVEVPSTTPAVADSTTALEDGALYVLAVSGTYTYWPSCPEFAPCIADAEYSLRPTTSYGPGWVLGDDVFPPTYPAESLDLSVDEANVDWGGYNISHTYFVYYTGTGAPVHFSIYDTGYGDNSGFLTVEIYKVNP